MIVCQDDGFVRVFRRVYAHPVFQNMVEASIFVWMIAMANWREATVQAGARGITLRRGQLVVSERELSKFFNIPKTSLHGLIARLRGADMIDVARPSDQSRTECRPSADLRWTIITVKNYEQYQSTNPESTDGTDQSRTSRGPGIARDRTRRPKNTETIQSSIGQEGKKEGNQSESLPNATALGRGRGRKRAVGDAIPKADRIGEVQVPDARKQVWQEGPKLVSMLTGESDTAARSILGRMMALSGEDPVRILRAIEEARRRHPLLDPEAFLMAWSTPAKNRPYLTARDRRDRGFEAWLTPEQRDHFAQMRDEPDMADGVAVFELDLQADLETIT